MLNTERTNAVEQQFNKSRIPVASQTYISLYAGRGIHFQGTSASRMAAGWHATCFLFRQMPEA
jgi:hypothetical protein